MTTSIDTRWLIAGLGMSLALLVGLLAGHQPVLAIAVALAIGLLMLALADLTAATCVFTLLIFLQALPGVTGRGLSLTTAANVVLVLSWLGMIARNRERDLVWAAHPVLALAALLFVTWTALGAIWAESLSEASIAVGSYGLNATLLAVVFTAVRTPRDLRLLLAAYVIGATVTSIYGLFAPPSLTGLAQDPGAASELGRVSGSIGDPNLLGALLVPAIVVALALARTTKPPLPRLPWLGCAALCLTAALMSLSRGGLIAILVALVATPLFAYRARARALLATVAAAGAVLVLFFGLIPPEARDRITAADGGSGRTDIWKVGWRIVEDEPIRGIGTGNFHVSSINYLLHPGTIEFGEYFITRPAFAHNTYLHVLAENGFVGLTLFLAIIGASLIAAMKSMRRFRATGDESMAIMMQAFVVAMLALLAADMFISEQLSKALWLMVAIGPAALRASGAAPTAAPAAEGERRGRRPPAQPAARPSP